MYEWAHRTEVPRVMQASGRAGSRDLSQFLSVLQHCSVPLPSWVGGGEPDATCPHSNPGGKIFSWWHLCISQDSLGGTNLFICLSLTHTLGPMRWDLLMARATP